MVGVEGRKGGKAEWKAIIDLKSPVPELSHKDEQKQVEASGDLGSKGWKSQDARCQTRRCQTYDVGVIFPGSCKLPYDDLQIAR